MNVGITQKQVQLTVDLMQRVHDILIQAADDSVVYTALMVMMRQKAANTLTMLERDFGATEMIAALEKMVAAMYATAKPEDNNLATMKCKMI